MTKSIFSLLLYCCFAKAAFGEERALDNEKVRVFLYLPLSSFDHLEKIQFQVRICEADSCNQILYSTAFSNINFMGAPQLSWNASKATLSIRKTTWEKQDDSVSIAEFEIANEWLAKQELCTNSLGAKICDYQLSIDPESQSLSLNIWSFE